MLIRNGEENFESAKNSRNEKSYLHIWQCLIHPWTRNSNQRQIPVGKHTLDHYLYYMNLKPCFKKLIKLTYLVS